MEEWELDFQWLKTRHYVKDSMSLESLPDLQAILFLIGLQEFGNWVDKHTFSKEEKQDLMHVAVCSLLEKDGYYRFTARDQDGWPHFENIKPFQIKGVGRQEQILKEKIIEYFNVHEHSSRELENREI